MTPTMMPDVDIGSGVALISLLTAAVPLCVALRPTLRRAARFLHHQGLHEHQVRIMRRATVLKSARRA